MSATHKGPGGFSNAVHHPAFFTGMLTGVLLSFVMFGWLFAANRAPSLDQIAEFRNWICLGAFGFVMIIPVLRFFRSPGRIFLSGFAGWILLCIAYASANMYFINLSNRFSTSPFKLLVMGAVLYGVAGAAVWISGTIVGMLRHNVPVPAARPAEVTTHPR